MNKAARLLEEKRETEQTKRVWFQTHQQREQEKGWFPHAALSHSLLSLNEAGHEKTSLSF